jgi:hypothetical protein
MQVNFAGRLDKMFILNPSTGLNFSWRVISSFVNPDTAEKITFLGVKEFPKILEKIPVEQLEVKFGGTIPNVVTFWYAHSNYRE